MHQMNSFFALLPDRLWQWLRQSNPEVSSHIQLFLNGSGMTPWQLMALADRLDLDYLSLAHRVGLITALKQLISSSVDTKKSDQLKKKILYFISHLNQENKMRSTVDPIILEIKETVQSGAFSKIDQKSLSILEAADEKAQRLNLPKLAEYIFHSSIVGDYINKLSLDSSQKELIVAYMSGGSINQKINNFMRESDKHREFLGSLGVIFKAKEKIYTQPPRFSVEVALKVLSAFREKKDFIFIKNECELSNEYFDQYLQYWEQRFKIKILDEHGDAKQRWNLIGYLATLVDFSRSDDYQFDINFSDEQAKILNYLAAGHDKSVISSDLYGTNNEEKLIYQIKLIKRKLKMSTNATYLEVILRAHVLGFVSMAPQRLKMYVFMSILSKELGLKLNLTEGKSAAFEMLREFQNRLPLNDLKRNFDAARNTVANHIYYWMRYLKLDKSTSSRQTPTQKQINDIADELQLRDWVVPPAADPPPPLLRDGAPQGEQPAGMQ